MPVYVVGIIRSRDQDAYDTVYLPTARRIIKENGGRSLIRAITPPNRIEVLAGDLTPNRVAVVEFPDAESAHKWYDSEEYHKVKDIRNTFSEANTFLIHDTTPNDAEPR